MKDISICGIFSSATNIGKNFTPTTSSLESLLVKLKHNKDISEQPIGAFGCTAYLDFLSQITSTLMNNPT